MKVEKTVLFAGDLLQNQENGQNTVVRRSGRKGNDSVFGGGLNLNQVDPIAMKRKQAKEQAKKVVSDAFAAEQQLDNEKQARLDRVKELRGTIKENHAILKDYEKQKEDLLETYGGMTDSKEYQDRVAEIDKLASPYKLEIADAEKEIAEKNAITREVNKERLKSHPILDATEQADDIMEAASDEIKGMLIGEAKDHIDEVHEEQQEEAEKKKEEKEEKEERIEDIKQEKAEEEQRIEEIRQKAESIEGYGEKAQTHASSGDGAEIDLTDSTRMFAEYGTIQDKVENEIENIMTKMKLIEEDVKGTSVDTKI